MYVHGGYDATCMHMEGMMLHACYGGYDATCMYMEGMMLHV